MQVPLFLSFLPVECDHLAPVYFSWLKVDCLDGIITSIAIIPFLPISPEDLGNQVDIGQ